MTEGAVKIENGFAEVGGGSWLVGCGQPVAHFGEVVRRRRKGWFLRDRSALALIATTGRAFFAVAARPFLTLIPCAATISAVSGKVLLAPAAARIGAELVKIVPMSTRHAICVTTFGMPSEVGSRKSEVESQKSEAERLTSETEIPGNIPSANHFVVLATASRTTRIVVADGDTLSVRHGAVAAWTGNRPTGFVRRIGIADILLPRPPRDLALHFHGPCVVWTEGAPGKPGAFHTPTFNRRNLHGV